MGSGGALGLSWAKPPIYILLMQMSFQPASNEFKFTLITFEHKEQQMLLLISQSPYALGMGTAWKVLMSDVMVTMVLKAQTHYDGSAGRLWSALPVPALRPLTFLTPGRVPVYLFRRTIKLWFKPHCRLSKIYWMGKNGLCIFLHPFPMFASICNISWHSSCI